MVTPKPPAAVEEGLPGGPGYFFNRKTLRPLSDASGGRVRRFCAESSVRLLDGSRLTPTNAIQAGEMRYHEGGSSPYHRHVGTSANPDGASHCYITFKGRGVVQVGDIPRNSNPARSCISPRAYRIDFVPMAVLSTTLRSRLGGALRPTCSARSRWDSSGTTTPRHRVPRGWSGTRANETPFGRGRLPTRVVKIR